MNRPVVLRLRAGVKPLRAGHPWVYRDADVRALGALRTGTVVDVVDAAGGAFIARGLYDADSDLAVRLFTWDEGERLDFDLVRSRLERAVLLRERFTADDATDAYRLVNGEGDDLPGLVVDRYGPYAVLQPYSALWLPWLADAARVLAARAGLDGVLLRSRVRSVARGQAGVLAETALAGREPPPTLVVKEHGLAFEVAPRHGQKTGLFLDQRDNRRAVAALCPGRRVLNLFAYTGGFSVHAAAAGARSIVSVDVADGCARAAHKNFELNDLGHVEHRFVQEDAFAWLESARAERPFDVVIVDPPSFATSRRQVEAAARGYVRLMTAAARVVAEDGIAAFCSCTAQVGEAQFLELVAEAGRAAGRELALLAVTGLPADHPTRAALPESRYLKCVIARVGATTRRTAPVSGARAPSS